MPIPQIMEEQVQTAHREADHRCPSALGPGRKCAGCPDHSPGAHLGAHFTDFRCASASDLKEIVELVRLTSATADRRANRGCAFSAAYEGNREFCCSQSRSTGVVPTQTSFLAQGSLHGFKKAQVALSSNLSSGRI